MIDLRSDVCSVPTDAMWEAMRDADLGWALVGEDASVNTLCERVATLLGKPAALWLPTLGMGNLVAMLTFCAPGEKVVLEAASHVLSSESMGITEIARLEPRPLWAADGRMDPAAVEEVVAENRAALLMLENTHTRAGGTTLSAELTAELAAAAKRHDCRVHLDGARLLNASIALGVPLADLAAPANSVVISLNKALSAPFGAVLAGSEAVVERARLMAHRLGGGSVHRAGIAAAAALVALDTDALDTVVDRIAEDHRRARELGELLAAIPGVRLQPETVETNIVLADVSGTGLSSDHLIPLLHAAGLRVFERDLTRLRFVTHPLVDDAAIERAAAIVAGVIEQHAVPPSDEPEVEGLDEYLAWEAEQIEAIERAGRAE
jgi:threonine aldolase